MLSKFRCILIVSYLITCIDIVYGYNIKRLEDLLDENISLEDRSNYLDYIKDNYPL